jgi:hypothetical protein
MHRSVPTICVHRLAWGFTRQGVGGIANSYVAASNTGSGVLALNSLYTQSLDLSKIGDGSWYLGSTQNGQGLNGTFNGGTLGAGAVYNGLGAFVGADAALAAYRLGAGGQTLYVGLYQGATGSVPNQLSGAANLVVGAPVVNGALSNPTNATGTVILNSAQNYTGQTLVNRASTLEVRGAMATSGYEVFGTLALGGLAAVGSTPVTLRAGAVLRLDDSFDTLSPGSQRCGCEQHAHAQQRNPAGEGQHAVRCGDEHWHGERGGRLCDSAEFHSGGTHGDGVAGHADTFRGRGAFHSVRRLRAGWASMSVSW